MEKSQTTSTRFVEHPVCERCGIANWLIRIEPVQPGCETHVRMPALQSTGNHPRPPYLSAEKPGRVMFP